MYTRHLYVTNENGSYIPAQIHSTDWNTTKGEKNKEHSRYELFFEVLIPPLGLSTYFIHLGVMEMQIYQDNPHDIPTFLANVTVYRDRVNSGTTNYLLFYLFQSNLTSFPFNLCYFSRFLSISIQISFGYPSPSTR